jgi:transcription initiation factor TFIID subunit 11
MTSLEKTQSNKRARESVDNSLVDEIRYAENDFSTNTSKKVTHIKSKLDLMNNEQLTRFEYFFRSHLRQKKVKELIAKSLPKRLITDDMSVVVSGLAKLFTGELMETTMNIVAESGGGGVKINHLEEAIRLMELEGKIGKKRENSDSFVNNNMISNNLIEPLNISLSSDEDSESEN